MPDTPLLSVNDLAVHFPIGGGRVVRAVDGVSFSLERGETLGLVGESGSGKSTTGRALLRLLPATRGSVIWNGADFLALGPKALISARQRLQMVFQDPYASLSPRRSIGQTLMEPLEIHQWGANRDERRARVDELLQSVGLPVVAASRFPHEFSGGQRQRIGIARALALDPEMIVLDEPVSALDISVRAQVVNLLTKFQETRSLSYLFIGHDLSLIRRVAHRVAVMYLGRIIEIGPAETLYTDPRHPYTRSLLDASPTTDPTRRRERRLLQGDPPSPIDLPSGCRFRTRCPFAQEICAEKEPALEPVFPGETRLAACHFSRELPVWQNAQNAVGATDHR